MGRQDTASALADHLPFRSIPTLRPPASPCVGHGTPLTRHGEWQSMEHHPRREGGRSQQIGFWLGLGFFVLLMAFPVDPANVPASRLAAVALLMAIWWVTDAIPLFATALRPARPLPDLLGIMGGRATAPIYFNSTIVLFIGGFMIALTMEKWNLHRESRWASSTRSAAGPRGSCSDSCSRPPSCRCGSRTRRPPS